MIKETAFLLYWRELDAQLRLLGKRPATLGLAQACWGRMCPATVARVVTR